MAFSEQDRVYIRQYLGYAAIWLQADPRLESAITTIQSVADGGSRPDSSSENQARVYIAKCQDVDQRLDDLDDLMGGGRVDESTFDVVKEDRRLRQKGRMYVYRLAKLLDTEPRGDVFSASPAQGEDLRATAAFPPFPYGGRTAY